MLGIQFALYFGHLQGLALGFVFTNFGLVAVGDNISFRTIRNFEVLLDKFCIPLPISPAYFEATNQPHYFHQNVL